MRSGLQASSLLLSSARYHVWYLTEDKTFVPMSDVGRLHGSHKHKKQQASAATVAAASERERKLLASSPRLISLTPRRRNLQEAWYRLTFVCEVTAKSTWVTQQKNIPLQLHLQINATNWNHVNSPPHRQRKRERARVIEGETIEETPKAQRKPEGEGKAREGVCSYRKPGPWLTARDGTGYSPWVCPRCQRKYC
jgi:hypothetical protein